MERVSSFSLSSAFANFKIILCFMALARYRFINGTNEANIPIVAAFYICIKYKS
ncbi:hypothetical protein O6B42_05860 [Campylobacter ureolyticus]|uniref:hypothetical protein n=1 Tax=Campylobacter ureolyticus TaxID=827 RepID=UPI0022B38B3C|nr:hypothetical protein [Campylobacter ureolyticus]MCZ6133408.1 hypothetical protein [Campylobacter ureolyticus]